ncbi:hypothetical protein T03_16677 [Trichinella britovi]|uniref:Uncharacterized protein n=1 Tax=Trichinella britovi TaxID=45882 RepID=A0A0V1CEU6_TRIBR|nr:hypothetical protein T03_16677 [Trichinella britovi]
MPKLMKGATPNELVKRCDGKSDVNHWIKSTRASETITQKHSDAYRSSWGHLENSMPSNHVRRERKETIEQLNILYLPITFGVSEKRLREQILDEMRSDTQPR